MLTVGPKAKRLLQAVESPVAQAMVLICEKCGKRAGGSGKNVSYRLASHFKRQVKRAFGKGDIRIVLTTCMDICPDDRVTVAITPTAPGSAPLFMLVDIDDLEASSEALVRAIHRAKRRTLT
jgi:predicted metal-binding protein